VILLLSSPDNPDEHLQAMETIFKHVQRDIFRRFLRQSETAEAIVEKAKSMGGKAEFKTVQGETLTAMVDGDAVKVMDRQGHTATVTSPVT